jgi:hypothetical protein
MGGAPSPFTKETKMIRPETALLIALANVTLAAIMWLVMTFLIGA